MKLLLLLALSVFGAPRAQRLASQRQAERLSAPRVESAASAPGDVLAFPQSAVAEPSAVERSREAANDAAIPALTALDRGVSHASEGGLGAAFSSFYDQAGEVTETVIIPAGEGRDGIALKLGRYLGKGETTLVHQRADNPERAYRRPRPEPYYMTQGGQIPMHAVLDMFIDGHGPLAKAGVPVVGLHSHRRGHYAEVDYVEGPLLRHFLRRPELFSPAETAAMLADLAVFAAKTASFSSIHDFNSEQVMYQEGKGWVLFDFLEHHKPASEIAHGPNMPNDTFSHIYSEKAFNHMGAMRPQARAWITKVLGVAHRAIQKKRAQSLN